MTFIPFAIVSWLQVRSCLHPRGRGFPKEIKIRRQGLWDHPRVCLSQWPSLTVVQHSLTCAELTMMCSNYLLRPQQKKGGLSMLLPKPFMNYDPQLDSPLARRSGQDHLKMLSWHLTTILPLSHRPTLKVLPIFPFISGFNLVPTSPCPTPPPLGSQRLLCRLLAQSSKELSILWSYLCINQALGEYKTKASTVH